MADAGILMQFRAQFPSLAARTHFASCSYAPRSTLVSAALEQMLLELEHEQPWTAYEHKVAELRALVAELLGCEVEQVGLQPNATIAAYQVASSIDWSARPRIIASRAEFPSIAQVWQAQARRGAELVLIEHDAPDAFDAYRRVLDERVGLVSVPALNFVSGAKLPVAAIVALARQHGAVSFCDAYQLIGTEPLDAGALAVDYLVAGAMKYLLGLPGLAFLYARQPEAVQRVSTLTGWQGRVDPFAFEPLGLDSPQTARRFETGTPAIAPVYAAASGIRALLELGLQRVAERIAMLKQHVQSVCVARGLDLQYMAPPDRSGGHFGIRARDAKSLERRLLEHRVQVSPRRDAVRIAFHAFNSPEDVERLCEALLAARADLP
jgi:selenocysteine lyase/cysteine desulfurase